MICPRCGSATVAGSNRCSRCNATFDPSVPVALLTPPPASDETPTQFIDPTRETSSRIPASAVNGPLQPGQAFGSRYHIVRTLGIGGMGAVYEALDAELGVTVALKVIRPEVM